MHGERCAAAEADDVDVAVTRRELPGDVALRFLDAFMTAHTERATDQLAKRAVPGADALVEELRTGVEILEPDHVGIQVVPAGVFFPVPGAVECVKRHAGKIMGTFLIC